MSAVLDRAAHDGAFTPIGVAEVELTQPLPDLRGYDRYRVLVRLHTEPLGVVEVDSAHASATRLAARIWDELADELSARVRAAGAPAPNGLGAEGLSLHPATSPYLRRRAEVLADAPRISVVLCTRDPDTRLDECLDRLARQRYPCFEVIVVDNASATDAVQVVAARWSGRIRCRYVAEPRPGLSWARNAGGDAAASELLAFIDDDEAPDPHWLAELARGFADHPGAGCVSGTILPRALDARAQEWFEQFGGHSKGRGFAPAVFDARAGQSPLFPLPPFGAGGNMAFTRAAFADIDGFDVALGSGTPARAGEDTLAFTRVLLAGYSIAHQPSALVRHRHHEHVSRLRVQLHGYGVGLTAYYTALLRHDPRLLAPLLRLAPGALRELLGRGPVRTAAMRDFPAALTRAQRAGLLTGPLAYLRSCRVQANTARVSEGPP